mmetsp:Transcript_10411/g.22042  ORF Transcript_10411/g.22042 Transcript_10411/m.22042 type:complete len:552 (-) Transcript_10411:3799-5454(-)
MTHLYHPIALSFLIVRAASICHSFSHDTSLIPRSRIPSNLLRHRRHPPSCTSTISSRGTYFPLCKAVSPPTLTLRWNSPTDSDVSPTTTTPPPERQEKKSTSPPDLHPPTLQAIAHALFIRAQNVPGTKLRFADDGSMEPWEITYAAGTITQRFAEEWMAKENLNPAEDEGDEELMQVMSGRIMAVLTRLEELEEDLLKRCVRNNNDEVKDKITSLGVPEEELKAWETNEGDPIKRVNDVAAAIDAVCLFDEPLRYNRARSLLAMFLHEIEGPGMRRNNVVIPCMDVDFLSKDEASILFGSKDKQEELSSSDDDATGDSESTSAAIDDSAEEESDETGDVADEKMARPSLHPITIDAIEDALRLRAQNSTTSPLRIIDAQMEWFEVQYSIMKFADRFMEKYTKAAASKSENDESPWTEEELQTIGGRIVGVLMRLDDLEWEWNHRISTSSLADPDSPSMVPYDLWKTTLGLHAPHPEAVEQTCFRTVDASLSEEKEFARTRAERMLALFLMNIEGPGFEASGNEVPGGSTPEFIEDAVQLELMMPRTKKND